MEVPLDARARELGAEIGVFGGSGFYDLLDDADDVELTTPFGSPASNVRVGSLAGRRVAFVARHGRSHEYAAHRVPFRANVWALAALGVRSIVGPCSVGALRADLGIGDFVVLDQLVDRTQGRAGTFHDAGAADGLPGSGGPVHHQPFADPYDAEVRRVLVEAGRSMNGPSVHDGGTMVVINGPRFSTRAESRWYAAMGWDVVNMTGAPEAALAAEAGVPYASIALVTDHDAGDHDGTEAVTMDAVMAVVRRNVDNVKRLIETAVPHLP
ncbi:S-methyl-5'-thioadenosine phosphorylase [Ilumatobacter nonamiensis]|uniref:S-methyl-5'-thioadenosine phosphorylase n=1 Tax=Ilumatobacter nonamiensis TaxID=467093 RepID=UPI000349F964|nr:S-methyl-5'-thioadenosine phosphorylase [Ilumatobacter nonamiensis]